MSSRLLVISNRLPLTIKRTPEGGWSFTMSSGGLVAGLSGLKESTDFIWIGWLGQDIDPAERPALCKILLEQHSCVPVFVPDDLADAYYNGFSNKILWPLFHYMPGELKFQDHLWESYCEANQIFADAISRVYKEGDLVWVHDYHLMLVPQLLRETRPNAKIGWFLHTPFPSSEIYRVLPVRDKVLRGILECDMIGFHTYDYARHFQSACTRILGLETTPDGVDTKTRFVSVGVFPIGIEPDKFFHGLDNKEIQDRVAELKERYKGKKIIIGVDRLDYIKGVPHKLEGFELFLQQQPEWQGKVVFIQIAVPSRTDVEEYQRLRQDVNESVGRINGIFGTLDYYPIHYLNKSVNFVQLTALYRISDVCYITSIRDGMNLVSYEYITCQEDNHGVLILSEFAGSAQSLSGAVMVNPWDTQQLADAVHQALTMPADERASRHQKLFRYVTTYTSAFWGESFVAHLQETTKDSDTVTKVPVLPVDDVAAVFKASKKRLVVFDYDGVLAELQVLPQLATMVGETRGWVEALGRDDKTFVFVVSGRTREGLAQAIGDAPIGACAEAGCFVRYSPDEEWRSATDDLDTSWRDTVAPIFDYFTDRTPGSFVEEKEIHLTWHYRNADPDFGSWQARELQLHLDNVLGSSRVEILLGDKTVEVRPRDVSKGTSVRRLLADHHDEYDFVLYIGMLKTDQDVFVELNKASAKHKYLVSVHYDPGTQANYQVKGFNGAQELLKKLAEG